MEAWIENHRQIDSSQFQTSGAVRAKTFRPLDHEFVAPSRSQSAFDAAIRSIAARPLLHQTDASGNRRPQLAAPSTSPEPLAPRHRNRLYHEVASMGARPTRPAGRRLS